MALWDIKGKALNLPVWKLIGGKCREGVPCYANCWFSMQSSFAPWIISSPTRRTLAASQE